MADNIMDKAKFDTHFFERYARVSLVDLVDHRFAELENKDKPDLQDNQQRLGIEVTRAIRQNRNVAYSLINEIVGKPIMDVSEEDWGDITKYGYGYGLSNNIIGKTEYPYWATALPIKRMIDNKVSKVANGLYGKFETYGLYIFVKENMSDKFIKQIVDYIIKLQGNNQLKYSYMYISQIHKLFVCNLANASFEGIEISKAQCRKFYKEAIA
jgi:hypothetical protein